MQAEDAFAAGRTRAVANAIDLYQALAGGWPSREPAREAIATTSR